MELWDLYDRAGHWHSSGHPRGKPIPAGLYHKVVSVLVQHEDGTYLAMQSSIEKGATGGYYEISASGAVLAGETPLVAVQRELREETGLTGTDWRLLTAFVYPLGQALYYLYAATTASAHDAVQLEPHETSAYRWVNLAEVPQLVANEQLIGAGAEWLLTHTKP